MHSVNEYDYRETKRGKLDDYTAVQNVDLCPVCGTTKTNAFRINHFNKHRKIIHIIKSIILTKSLSHQKQHRINFDLTNTQPTITLTMYPSTTCHSSIHFLCSKTNGIQQSNANTMQPDKQLTERPIV